MLHQIR